MDCPVGTVRSRIFRAREAMITKFNRLSGVDDSGILDKGIGMQKEQLSALMDGETLDSECLTNWLITQKCRKPGKAITYP